MQNIHLYIYIPDIERHAHAMGNKVSDSLHYAHMVDARVATHKNVYIYIYNMQHVVRICILPLHEACLLRIQRFPRLDVDPGKLGSLFDSLGKG